MKQRFKVYQHRQGWFRLTAETAQKVTILVCECETRDLVLHMQKCLNSAPDEFQNRIIADSIKALLKPSAQPA